MRLYLVRHGKYEGEALSPEGRRETEEVASQLGEISPTIFHSTKLRAKQTATIFAQKLNCELEEHEELAPNDPIQPILDEILGREKDLMLVGHLPFLEILLLHLVPDCPLHFKNSSVITLEPGWKVLGHLFPTEVKV